MTKKLTIIFGVLAGASVIVYTFVSYGKSNTVSSFTSFPFEKTNSQNLITQTDVSLPSKDAVLHVPKPEHVKAVYMSSWVAGTESMRNRITSLVNETEINSIVIDFKDSEGVVSLSAPMGSSQDRINAGRKRAPELAKYLEELHSNGIYTIARIAVFEDPIYSRNHHDQAVQNSLGELWADKHGLSWVDASSPEFHKYILSLALEAYDMGFDEINLDYIRFPTDGAKDKVFPVSLNKTKPEVINAFLSYIHSELKAKNIPLSIDVFGQIMSTADDMGIGQYYDDLLKYTDTIAPMVYPSHFNPGYKSLKSPESSPYETIKYSLTDAITRKTASGTDTEIRPWIQDFSLAVPYDAKMVRAQINAAHDLGIDSFLLWDPKNRYTKEALNLEQSN